MVITLPRKKTLMPTFIPRDEFLMAAEESAKNRHAREPADLREFMGILSTMVPPLSVSPLRIHKIFVAALSDHMQINPPEKPLSSIGLDARAAVMGLDVVAHYKKMHATTASVVSLFPR